jgi:hypothetical protein
VPLPLSCRAKAFLSAQRTSVLSREPVAGGAAPGTRHILAVDASLPMAVCPKEFDDSRARQMKSVHRERMHFRSKGSSWISVFLRSGRLAIAVACVASSHAFYVGNARRSLPSQRHVENLSICESSKAQRWALEVAPTKTSAVRHEKNSVASTFTQLNNSKKNTDS